MDFIVFEWKVVRSGRQSSSKNGQGQVRNEDAGLYVLCWMLVGARSVHRFWTRGEREESVLVPADEFKEMDEDDAWCCEERPGRLDRSIVFVRSRGEVRLAGQVGSRFDRSEQTGKRRRQACPARCRPPGPRACFQH